MKSMIIYKDYIEEYNRELQQGIRINSQANGMEWFNLDDECPITRILLSKKISAAYVYQSNLTFYHDK